MAVKKGRQTPTKSLILPYEKSKGSEAVRYYKQTGYTAQPWQKSLVKDMMAVNSDKLWTHTKFGYAVSRRNGKTEILCVRMLYGLKHGEAIKYTAHLAATSRAIWEHMCELLDKLKWPYDSYKSAGREEISLHDGGRIQFSTRTGRGGLGTGCDLLIIDEAQEYTLDQESALKYTVTSSANPQTIMCGTPPTTVSSGTVFKDLRSRVFEGKTMDTGWAEWSVERMTDVWDRNAWYETNPSLGMALANGVPLLKERDVAAEIGEDETDFNIQRLGLWLEYNQKSAITAVLWDKLRTTEKAKVKRFCVGVKFGVDGINACLAVAAKQPDGRIYVEAVDKRPLSEGIGWIVDFLCKNKAYIQRVVVDGAGRQQAMADAMKEAKLKKPVIPATSDVIAVYSIFENAVYNGALCHSAQEAVDHVATNCTKRNIGSRGGFGYAAIFEEDEIGLLESIALAHWACVKWKETKQTVGY